MDIQALYQPWPHQVPAFKALSERRANRIVTVWHRRAGKDLTAFNALWIEAIQHRGNYGYFFPFATQGRRAIWHGITSDGPSFREFIPADIIENVHDTEMRITLTNGSTIQFIGTDNIDAKMGANFKGVVMSEYSLQDPRAWDFIEPILKLNGGWAWFPYTPRGKENHGYTLYKAAQRLMEKGEPWFAQLLTIEDTGLLTDADLDDLRERGVQEAHIQQEYYCSFEQQNEGSYFGHQLEALEDEGRLSSQILWNPSELVHTGWDLGVNDSTCIWFMQRGKGSSWMAIDYFEAANEGLEFYLKALSEKPYVYGTHLVPHDADQRHFPAITSTVEAAHAMGWAFDVIPKTAKKTQIEATHRFLPRLWANSSTCATGLSALKNYERKWDDRLKVFSNNPLHNWASHPTDAFMTFVLGHENIRDAWDDAHLPSSSTGDYNANEDFLWKRFINFAGS